MSRKVVDLTTLYKFYEGSIVFFSTDFAQSAAKLWMSPCLGEQELLSVDHVFHQFTLKIWNANLHESCVPRQTGQLSYWEILKCLGEIWRTRQKFRKTFTDIRVLVGFDRVFDHTCVFTWSRGSIGFVGEVFEVMTQVDLGSTNASRFESADSIIHINDAN
jgi:hypothetical protein